MDDTISSKEQPHFSEINRVARYMACIGEAETYRRASPPVKNAMLTRELSNALMSLDSSNGNLAAACQRVEYFEKVTFRLALNNLLMLILLGFTVWKMVDFMGAE